LFSSTTAENPSSASSHAAAAIEITDSGDDDPTANFLVNPHPFLVVGLAVEHGWNHPARGRMALGSETTREHDDFAIVTINPAPQEAA
jgi:hypothetical protein